MNLDTIVFDRYGKRIMDEKYEIFERYLSNEEIIKLLPMLYTVSDDETARGIRHFNKVNIGRIG